MDEPTGKLQVLAEPAVGLLGTNAPPCTVRTDNALKVRFSATLGEEPEIEGGWREHHAQELLGTLRLFPLKHGPELAGPSCEQIEVPHHILGSKRPYSSECLERLFSEVAPH